MTAVDEIKDRLDIVEVVSEYVSLNKSGSNFKALCPFHTEKTPSFVVFPDGQNWHCFGACSTGGDIFSFVMQAENMDFSEALRVLARKAGVELQPRSPQQAAEAKRRQRLYGINTAAAQYFHNLLLNASPAEQARAYVSRRGISDETVEVFQLGYSLDSWDALKGYLLGKGYELADVHDAGLIIERDGGGYYDRFRGRLVFPIRDHRGRTIGFGGRVLDDGEPKYLNSPQTPVFDKGSVLYGLDQALDDIRREGEAVIVEGYTDVLTAYQHGFRNVVASLGTALTENQVQLLNRYADQFLLALDADTAGREATVRGLEVAREALKDRAVPVPTWRGLIRYESRLEGQMNIIALPQDKDPDDVIRNDPVLWKELLSQAVPVVDFVFDALTSGLDLSSAKGKSEAVRRLTPVIRDIGDRVEQAHYLQKLARLVRMDESALAGQVFSGQRRSAGSRSRRPVSSSASESVVGGLEEYLLAALLQEPRLAKVLQEAGERVETAPLAPEDFSRVENREIFSVWRECAGGGQAVESAELRMLLDDALHSHLKALQESTLHQPPVDGEVLDKEIVLCFLRLRERNSRQQIQELRFLIGDAEESNDQETLERYREQLLLQIREIHRLQQALSGGAGLDETSPAGVFPKVKFKGVIE